MTGRKAVVIFVPFKLLKVVHKIQSRLVREVNTAPHQTRTRSSTHTREGREPQQGAQAALLLRRLTSLFDAAALLWPSEPCGELRRPA